MIDKNDFKKFMYFFPSYIQQRRIGQVYFSFFGFEGYWRVKQLNATISSSENSKSYFNLFYIWCLHLQTFKYLKEYLFRFSINSKVEKCSL